MIFDINSFNMTYLLFTILILGGILAYSFYLEVKQSISIFRKVKDLQITYDDCPNFHDMVALYIVRNF